MGALFGVVEESEEAKAERNSNKEKREGECAYCGDWCTEEDAECEGCSGRLCEVDDDREKCGRCGAEVCKLCKPVHQGSRCKKRKERGRLDGWWEDWADTKRSR